MVRDADVNWSALSITEMGILFVDADVYRKSSMVIMKSRKWSQVRARGCFGSRV